ncbi:uncharacterized protein LOC144421467 [Styela clava]
MSDIKNQIIVVLAFFLIVIVCHWGFTLLSNRIRQYDMEYRVEQSIINNSRQECDLRIEKHCYIAVVYTEAVTYTQAVSICRDSDSSIAQILNENTYNDIVKNIRSKIPVGYISTSVWIKGPVTDEFIKWQESQLRQSISNWRELYLVVDRDPGSNKQGLRTGFALSALRGVVCER